MVYNTPELHHKDRFEANRRQWTETETHIYFWRSLYSQWYPSLFKAPFYLLPGNVILGVDFVRSHPNIKINEINTFNCAEQYMMANKAVLFGDWEILDEIMGSNSPKNMKDLGKLVRGYDDEIWVKHRLPIVIQGNYYKFRADTTLRDILLESYPKILVEGSPLDRIWGVGLAWDEPAILDEANWNGLNLLGKALVEARGMLYREFKFD